MSRSLLLAVLLPAPLGLVTTQAADREPAMVAPGSDAMTEADIAAGAAEDTLGPAGLGYSTMQVLAR